MPYRIKMYLLICSIVATFYVPLTIILSKYYQWVYKQGEKHWWMYNRLNLLYNNPPTISQMLTRAFIAFILGLIVIGFNFFGIGDKFEQGLKRKSANIHKVGVKRKGKVNFPKSQNSENIKQTQAKSSW